MPSLYVVATPIGNLKDITLRALEVFKSVETIVCEDTRETHKLLHMYDIKKILLSYHQHSSEKTLQRVIELLENGEDIVYVSDAGTPGVQDPGNVLVEAVYKYFGKDVSIVPIPGTSAVTALASVAGLPTDSFLFAGFLPKKKGRQKQLKEIVESKRTVIFYESSHRIVKSLNELREALAKTPDRRIVVGRELTKKFETIYRGTVEDVVEQLETTSTKGEFVVVVEGK